MSIFRKQPLETVIKL